ncbi:hypothetical protein PV325_003072 [Microctonus aethiopoides]|uniref:Odorant receptor n=1 Tax=Microctonus aethiopoides TaxID=144406 RepID=A0AA39FPW6_9HYME|nr:hypothetical protein PV325_003072 [Microctonus aethiopoides]KAK0173654.1 hypothetical protein PV328_006820 [Microctonus aethiopoides]
MVHLEKPISEPASSESKKLNAIVEVVKETRWIFSILGVWHMIKKNTTTTEKSISRMMHLICQSLLAFVIIPAIIQLCWREKNINVKLAYFGPLGCAIACALKYLIIIYRHKAIKNCIEKIEKNWYQIVNEENLAIMIKNMEMGKRMTTLCGSFMYCGGVLHQIMIPFLPGSMVSIANNSSGRLLVYPVYDMMFNDQMSPVYEIMYIIHIITGMIVCTTTIASSHLSILFTTHISGQNQIIILKLKNLINTEDTEEQNVNQRMAEIIKFHLDLIKFSFDVEKTLREICMIATLEALCIICMAEYYSIVAWKHNESLSTIIHLILLQAFIGNFFVFCHIGELLKEQFQKAGEAVYMTEWYRLSQKNAKAMIVINAVTQHPPKITAGALMELSYDGFVFVIKTTAAYFNILRMVEL